MSSSALPPSSGELPLVVLLDLDGTMVGRVGPLLCEYELHKALAAAKATAKATGGSSDGSSSSSSRSRASRSRASAASVPKALRDSIVARLGWGVIRPHLVRFCKGVGPGIELFVYTASDATWASFIVPCVEASLGVKFNRPIFTREDCVRHAGFRKTIDGLKPAIVRSLKRRYPAMTSPASLRDRVVLVDNTANVMVDPRESSRVVACPTYDYQCNYDVLSHIAVGTLHNEHRVISTMLERHGLFHGPSVDSYQRFAAVYYKRLARALEATLPANMASLAGDRFFLQLELALNSLIRRSARSPSSTMPACLTDAGVREVNSAIAAGQHRQHNQSNTTTSIRSASLLSPTAPHLTATARQNIVPV